MMKVLLLGSRVVLGTVFIASGILKLISPDKAVEFIGSVLTLNPIAGTILVGVGSILEIGLGALLLFVISKVRQAALVSAGMLLVFTLMGVVESGNPRSCGCFGTLFDTEIDEVFFVRNIVLLFGSMFLLRFYKQSRERS